MTVDPAVAAGWGFVLLAGAAFFLWLWVPRPRPPTFAPITRILGQAARRVVRVRAEMPRKFEALLFLLMCAVVGLLSLRPAGWRVVPRSSSVRHLLVVVDDSVSVSRFITWEALVARLEAQLRELEGLGKVSLARLSGSEVVSGPEATAQLLRREGFSFVSPRFSQRLAVWSAEQMPRFSDLVLWTDLDQSHFSDLRLGEFDGQGQPLLWLENLADLAAGTPAWNLYLSEPGLEPRTHGGLSVVRGEATLVGVPPAELELEWQVVGPSGEVLATSPGELEPGREQVSGHVLIRDAVLEKLAAGGGKLRLGVSPGDAIALDRERPLHVGRLGRRVIVVHDLSVEDTLESAPYHLRAVLETAGALVSETHRLDLTRDVAGAHLVGFLSGRVHSQVPSVCDQLAAVAGGDRPPPLWLIASAENESSFGALCNCYLRLSGDGALAAQAGAACRGAYHRSSLAQVLFGTGSEQIGGDGNLSSALAWRLPGGRPILAWAFALQPLHPATSLDVGRFALLTEHLFEVATPDSPPEASVPVGESLLRYVSPPPTVRRAAALTGSGGSGAAAPAQVERDATPWVQRLVVMVLALLATEVAWGVWAARVAMLVVAAPVWGDSFDFVPYFLSSSPQVALERVAKMTERRTSLRMSPRGVELSRLADFLSRPYPVLFTRNPRALLAGSQLDGSVAGWLDGGGTLVIEAAPPRSELEGWTRDAFAHRVTARWEAIAGDHELLRAFYLLPLPSACGSGSQVWSGLRLGSRTVIVAVAGSFFGPECRGVWSEETERSFINLVLMLTTTDYKKDQIHLKEVLKRIQ